MEDACGRTCGAVQHDEATGEGKPSSAPKLVSEYLQHYKEQLLRDVIEARDEALSRNLPITNSIIQFNPQSVAALRRCATNVRTQDKNWYLALANMVEQDLLLFVVQQDRTFEQEHEDNNQANVEELRRMARAVHNLAATQVEILDAVADSIKGYDKKEHASLFGMGAWIAEARAYSQKYVDQCAERGTGGRLNERNHN